MGPGSSHHVLSLRMRDQVRLRDSVLSGTEGGAEKGVASCTLACWEGREGRRAGWEMSALTKNESVCVLAPGPAALPS